MPPKKFFTPLRSLRENAQSASLCSEGSTAPLPSGVGVSQVYETCGMCKGVKDLQIFHLSIIFRTLYGEVE